MVTGAMNESAAAAVAETPPAEVVAPPATTPAKVEEPKAPEPAVEAKPEDKPPVTPDWKVAAAKEREKREAQQAKRLQQDAATKANAELAAQLARFKDIEAKAKTNPLEAAEALGLSYDALTKEYIKTLERGPPDPNTALGQKVQQLEGTITNLLTQLQQRETNSLISQFESDVKTTIESQAETFRYLQRAEEGPDLVREIVAAHWRETKETMATHEACRLANEYLQKQTLRFAGIEVAKVAAPPAAAPKPAAPTLSQDLRQGGTPPVPFSDETAELLAMVTRLQAQQGN